MKKRLIKLSVIYIVCFLVLAGCGKKTPETDPGVNTTDPSTVETSQGDDNTQTPEVDTNDGHNGNSGEQTTGDTNGETDTEGQYTNDPVATAENDYYGDFKEEGGTITYITGVSALEDGTYNATVFAGIETYAQGAGVSYSYSISNSNEEADCRSAIDAAIESGSHLIVTSGVHFNAIIGEYQDKYPELSFLMIDGVPQDSAGNNITIGQNVHCISFSEEQAGYLAGYITAMDGYTKFGFIGGEEVPPVIRYGSGYLQGIEAAADELGNAKDIEVDYWYSDSFLPNEVTYEKSVEWYDGGTQVIFACGGSLYESVLEAADEADGKMIGVDVNQNPLSDRIITSAMKGINKAVIVALDDYFAFGGWSEEMAGKESFYGIAEKCPSLPIEEWRFENVTLNDYWTVYVKMRNGEIEIAEDIDDFNSLSIKVNTY